MLVSTRESLGCMDGHEVVADEEEARGDLKEQVGREFGRGRKSDTPRLLQIGGRQLFPFERADMRTYCEDADTGRWDRDRRSKVTCLYRRRTSR